jgi:hypothetical protein
MILKCTILHVSDFCINICFAKFCLQDKSEGLWSAAIIKDDLKLIWGQEFLLKKKVLTVILLQYNQRYK